MSSTPQQGDGTKIQKVHPKRDGIGTVQLIEAEDSYHGQVRIHPPHGMVDIVDDEGRFFSIPLRNVEFVEWDNAE